MADMAGKVAIVTDGASGIGGACARLLAREGAKLVITDIDAAGGAALAGEITETGGIAVFLEQDVTDEARWPEVIASAERTHGRLDVMVANAGIGLLESIRIPGVAATGWGIDRGSTRVRHRPPQGS